MRGEDIAMTLEFLGAASHTFSAMKPAQTGDAFGIWFLTMCTVSDPEEPLRQASPINSFQDGARQLRHKSLMRESMATEQIRESLRLVICRSKDG
jgi:hypothetical protein